jgi:uncharacterized membrane protein
LARGDDARTTVSVVRRPIHPTIVCVPFTCFIGALLTDVVYLNTAQMMWADFSAWLVTAGVILGWLAVIGGIVDLVGRRYDERPGLIWVYAIGYLIALVLATFNMFVHTRDAWTSVVPWGLALSAATVVVLLLTTWIGWAALYRRERRVVP